LQRPHSNESGVIFAHVREPSSTITASGMSISNATPSTR
jgi:hypothetical protein